MVALEEALPPDADNANQMAYQLVPAVLNLIFGEGGWHTEQRASVSKAGGLTRWVVAGAPEEEVPTLS